MGRKITWRLDASFSLFIHMEIFSIFQSHYPIAGTLAGLELGALWRSAAFMAS